MAGENVEAPAIDLPDSLIDSFLDKAGAAADKGDAGVEEGTPADETVTDDDETPPEGQLESGEDGNEDEVGEEEESDEAELDDDNEEDEDSEGDDLEEDEDSETDDEEDEEEETFLSKETLKKHQKAIEKDPHLKAVYKSMQADFTRKQQETARHRQFYEQAASEYDDFAAGLADVAEGGRREQFLIDAALDNPEAFQRAYDRAAELLESPDEKKKYERERDVTQREKRVQAEERARVRAAQEARVKEIHVTTEGLAKRYGIRGEEGIDLVKELVAKQILENRTAKKHQDVYVTEEQIEAAVKKAARSLGVERSRTSKETQRQERQRRLEDAKKTARNSKRRVAPGGKRSPTATSPKPIDRSKLPKNADPLDARIDQLLSPG